MPNGGEVRLNYAFGDAHSQSVEWDGQTHTFVWVSITPTDDPVIAGSDIA
jgi:hypothetical protein